MRCHISGPAAELKGLNKPNRIRVAACNKRPVLGASVVDIGMVVVAQVVVRVTKCFLFIHFGRIVARNLSELNGVKIIFIALKRACGSLSLGMNGFTVASGWYFIR